MPEQERINPHLIKLARELDLPLVADNDAHFMRPRTGTPTTASAASPWASSRTRRTGCTTPKQLYVKSPPEMAERFGDLPEVLENTVRIADRCNVDLDFSASHAPVVSIVKSRTTPCRTTMAATHRVVQRLLRAVRAAAVRHSSTRGRLGRAAQGRLRPGPPRTLRGGTHLALRSRRRDRRHRARLEREVGILADKQISAYFLIVWDFVNWARQQGIPASARGSGVGTMVGYVLGLSNACPEHYGLLFERFTDPDRSEYPDIDIDICQNGRADVINYVREKYGHVAQIITFGRLKAKAAIKDVARVMGLAPAEGQRLANLVPAELNITVIDAALEKDAGLQGRVRERSHRARVIDTARALEDHARHAGVHAAGVVLATEPLDNIVPLCKATGNDDVVTQWDGPTCEKVGLLKMDFLGLRTLSTIERCKTLMRRDGLPDSAIWAATGRDARRGPPSDGSRPAAYDDQRVLDLFRRGDTAGMFQFESGRHAQAAAGDAARPPRGSHRRQRAVPPGTDGPHPRLLRPQARPAGRAEGARDRRRVHEPRRTASWCTRSRSCRSCTASATSRCAGVHAHQGDQQEETRRDRRGAPQVRRGRRGQGREQRTRRTELFDLILKFAGYGFNKSHSTGYAIIAYQTAYLKTYFPNQYMAALLTYESGARKVDDWAPYLEECRRIRFPDHTEKTPHIGVQVLPPDVNLSDTDFTVVFEGEETRDANRGHVRFGLSAIKGIGKAAIRSLVEERTQGGSFTSIFDFCERVSSRTVNKAGMESLVRCGAFDSVHDRDARAGMAAALDDAIAAGQSAAEDRRAGQLNMFAAVEDPSPATAAPESVSERPLPGVPGWDTARMLEGEHECLGFYVSGHPLDQHESTLREFGTHAVSEIKSLRHDQSVVLGGMLTRVRPTVVRKGASAGSKMAMLTLQDKTGECDGVVFSNVFARYGHHVQEDAILMLVGRVDRQRGEPQLIVDRVHRIEEAPTHLAGRLEIDFAPDAEGDPIVQRLDMVKGLLSQSGGSRVGEGGQAAEVWVRVPADDRRVTLRLTKLRVVAEPYLIQRLRETVGEQHVRVRAGSASIAAESAQANRRPTRGNGVPTTVAG